MTDDVRIAFNGPQSKAFRLLKPGHTVAIPWGRGIGKSWFIRVVCYLLVSQWDSEKRSGADSTGVRIVILMPTLEQFRKVHLAHLLAEIEGPWAFLGGKINKTLLRVDFPGGSWIQVVSAEAAQGARGIRCDVVMPDEADDIDPEVVESITQPWFTEPHSLRITLIGGTPKRGRYGLLWRAHAEWTADPKLSATHHSVHATCYDAPKHVDRNYIDTEVKPKTSTAVFRREYLCDFDSAEGLVYPMFTPTFHVAEPNYGVPYNEILVGVDHGYEDAGVFIVAGIIGSGRDAIVHLLEETYAHHHETSWWCERAADVATRYGRHRQRWYCDPSRPDRIVDLKKAIREALTKAGREPTQASVHEAENSIEPGVDAVADRIAIREREDGSRYARLYVSPTCVNTIREFGLYRRKRDPKNAERTLDDILDRDNHTSDALRYLVFTRFGGPRSGRTILGPNEASQYPETA